MGTVSGRDTAHPEAIPLRYLAHSVPIADPRSRSLLKRRGLCCG